MILGKSVARLVTRLQGEDDGLILGALLDGGQGVLKPNTIYEIVQCSLTGNLVLCEVGKSVVGTGEKPFRENIIGVDWAMNIEAILAYGKQRIFLTEEEILKLND